MYDYTITDTITLKFKPEVKVNYDGTFSLITCIVDSFYFDNIDTIMIMNLIDNNTEKLPSIRDIILMHIE